MKSKSGFTLFEIVITLLVITIIFSYAIPFLGLSLFRYDRSITNLQEVINLKMVIENITHDYINRYIPESESESEPEFDLLELSKRIGQTNTYVRRVGSPPSYFPYGYDGQNYIPYFVRYNEFVKVDKKGDAPLPKEINLIRDYSSKGRMLLVTIQPKRLSNNSLTVLFTEK